MYIFQKVSLVKKNKNEKNIHPILHASRTHIPRGHILNMFLNLSDTAKQLIRQRDTLRSRSPTNPHIRTLQNHIQENICTTNRQTWINTVESCSHKYNTFQYFSLLKSLFGKRIQTPPKQPITFNKQFTSLIPHSSDPEARCIKR